MVKIRSRTSPAGPFQGGSSLVPSLVSSWHSSWDSRLVPIFPGPCLRALLAISHSGEDDYASGQSTRESPDEDLRSWRGSREGSPRGLQGGPPERIRRGCPGPYFYHSAKSFDVKKHIAISPWHRGRPIFTIVPNYLMCKNT